MWPSICGEIPSKERGVEKQLAEPQVLLLAPAALHCGEDHRDAVRVSHCRGTSARAREQLTVRDLDLMTLHNRPLICA
jgi:hypothetical protein